MRLPLSFIPASQRSSISRRGADRLEVVGLRGSAVRRNPSLGDRPVRQVHIVQGVAIYRKLGSHPFAQTRTQRAVVENQNPKAPAATRAVDGTF
jgi:hypothetical protein